MGYRSDVYLAVLVPDENAANELLAIYRMQQDVTNAEVQDAWEKKPQGDGTCALVYTTSYVKWYETYTDVQAIESMFSLAETFSLERSEGDGTARTGFSYAWRKIRVGEEPNDVDVTHGSSPDEEGSCLSDTLWERLSARVEVTIDL